MVRLKDGAPLKEFLPLEGALTLRTIWRRAVGEGALTISWASPSMSSPNVYAIDSKSASFSAAI